MSDIGLIFTTWDLVLMACIAGSPGLAVGVAAGALSWRSRRIAGGLVGGAAGFALCLGAVLLWVFELK